LSKKEIFMEISILHLSDLHKNKEEEAENSTLLNSLENDLKKLVGDKKCNPPSLCIVSGDMIYGSKHDSNEAYNEISEQYNDTHDFLCGLANNFFDGDRNKIVILPCNHDICIKDVKDSLERLDINLGAPRGWLIHEGENPSCKV